MIFMYFIKGYAYQMEAVIWLIMGLKRMPLLSHVLVKIVSSTKKWTTLILLVLSSMSETVWIYETLYKNLSPSSDCMLMPDKMTFT